LDNTLMWGVIGAFVGGFIGKQILEWFNQGRFKPMIDLIISISVFIAISSLIIRGINAAINVLNSIPK